MLLAGPLTENLLNVCIEHVTRLALVLRSFRSLGASDLLVVRPELRIVHDDQRGQQRLARRGRLIHKDQNAH